MICFVPMKKQKEVKRTNKKVLGVFVSLLAITMLALPMSTVYAKNDKFIAVSGEFFLFYNGVPEFKFPDNNFIWSQTDSTAMWTGDIITSGTCDFTLIFIKPIWDGTNIVDMHTSVVHEVYTLTDPMIDGVQYYGELTISGDMGNWRILGGTEDMANIHGQGTKWSTENPIIIGYEGWIHFDP